MSYILSCPAMHAGWEVKLVFGKAAKWFREVVTQIGSGSGCDCCFCLQMKC